MHKGERMIVVKKGKDSLEVVEQASFDDDYMDGISYVAFEFTKKDADNLLEAIRFLNNSNWDKLSQYTGCDWKDSDEEEGYYPDPSNLVDTKTYLSMSELTILAGGDGFMKVHEKYTSKPVYSHSFSWWPLIMHFAETELEPEILGEAIFADPPLETRVGVVVDILTGIVTTCDCPGALRVDTESFEVVYQQDNREAAKAVAVKMGNDWRIDDNSIGLIQSCFAETAMKYFGY